MSESTLVRAVGPWVEGERFFDRVHEVRDLIELIDEGWRRRFGFTHKERP